MSPDLLLLLDMTIQSARAGDREEQQVGAALLVIKVDYLGEQMSQVKEVLFPLAIKLRAELISELNER